jgi:Flp pilus assembly protein TadG
MLLSSGPAERRGVIAPMTAVLLMFLLGMIAFAMDVSWICLSRSELQGAADSAALAGAQQLMLNYTAYNLPGQSQANQQLLLTGAMMNAKSSAKTYASYNSAGGVSALTLLDGDITIGFTDGTGKFTAHSANSTTYPNTVQVTMRRDSSANNPLKLFFAPVLGVKTISLTASATSTVYTGIVNSFQASNGNINMLPMTFDVNAWQNFLKTGQDANGNTTLAANGYPELQVYPSKTGAGNFGELSLDDSHTGASTTAGWIDNGVSSSDLQALINANLIPLSSHNPNNWDWQGNTGLKDSNIQAVDALVGKTFWMPLFKPYNSDPNNYQGGTGQGSNFFYNIVAFVPVTIMPAGNQQIIVQPATNIDPNAIFSSSTIVPAGTSSSYAATVLAPKLTN